MTVESALQKLGCELPESPASVAAYVGAVRTGNLIVTSGQLPWRQEKLLHTGKVGGELEVAQGQEAARQCALNALAQIKALLGDLDRVRRIVRVEGYVQSAAGFHQQPQVLNGASELFLAAFGERGRHTRIALGLHELPLNAPVQLAVWAEVE